MNVQTRRVCVALTRRGLPCRATPRRTGDFCATHNRLGVGVCCWGGPFDGLPLRAPVNAPLVAVVAVVRDAATGIVTCRREETVQHAAVLGWYVLTDAAAGLWLRGLRYRWQVRR